MAAAAKAVLSLTRVTATLSLCRTDPLLEVAVELEKVAMSDEYFIKRGKHLSV